jgi:iron complex outermembrane receptor protein
MLKVFSLLFIFLIVPCAVFAGDDTVDIGEVVVQSEVEPTIDETSSAMVVEPKKDAPLANTVVQLLEQTAGVNVRRFNGIDDFSALSLRGSTSSQVQIYLDDVPLVTAQGTLTDLNIIPMDALAGVEIYRGGSPGTLPESSIGGVVILKSKPKPEEFEWTVNAGYGSFGTIRLGVGQAQAIGPFSYRFTYDRFQSDGDFTYTDDNGTTFNKADDQKVKRQNNAFQQNAFFSKFTYDISEDFRLEFVDSFLQKGQGVPGLGSRQSLNAHLTAWRNIAAINLNKKHLFTQNLDGRLNVFFDYLNSLFDDPRGEIGLGPQSNDDKTYRFGESGWLSYAWGRYQIIKFLLAHRSEFYVPHTVVGAMTAGSRSHRHSISTGLEDEINLWGERILLVPSIRFESTFNNLSDEAADSENDANDYQISAKLGVKAKLAGDFYFKGNAYRGFRQPTFTELFGDRGALIGNPELKPEKALNFDAGFVYRFPDLDLFTGGCAEVAYFENHIDNLIQFLQTSQFTAKAQNLNNAVIRGVEASTRATFLDRLSLALHYTWQQAKDTSDTVTRGKFLPGRPQHQLGAMLVWREKWIEDFATAVTAQVHYDSGIFLDTQNLLEVKDRAILTAGISFDLFERVTASFTARNITDDQTVDAVGYPLPGRSYWGEIKVKL